MWYVACILPGTKLNKSYFLTFTALSCSLFLPNTCPCQFLSLFCFLLRSLKIPFRDMNGFYGNCLRPLPADGGCGCCSNISVRQCCQATSHMGFLATTPLQEPDNPLNLSLPPSPHTSHFPPSPCTSALFFLSKIAFNVTGSLIFFMALLHYW